MAQSFPYKDSTASVTGGRGTTFNQTRGKFAKKRTTPETDYDRLAERVWRKGRGNIRTKADFVNVYQSMMEGSNNRTVMQTNFVDDVFKRIQRKHPLVKSKTTTTPERREAFTIAGHKPTPAEFNFFGRVKGRTIKARRTEIKFKDKRRQVYRDRRGRFVSVTNK